MLYCVVSVTTGRVHHIGYKDECKDYIKRHPENGFNIVDYTKVFTSLA